MGWQNAPMLNKLTSAQQGGNRGAQLWGVDFKGALYTIYQKTPGGEWSNWLGPDWAGSRRPKQVYELAATQYSDGRVVLFVLDMNQELWMISQNSPGGDWSGWDKPGWNGMPKGGLKKLTAAQQGPNGKAQLWALTAEGTIVGSHQISNDRWFEGWYEWQTTPENSTFVELTAARQGDGRSALWGLDTKRQLWGMGQSSFSDEVPPGGWGSWVGPNWLGAPKMRNIAACEGKQGVYLWGIGEDEYRIFHNWQLSPQRDNKWGGWQIGDWMNGPMSYELTAARQNNGCSQVWAISLKQVLHSIAETGKDCYWEKVWTPSPKTA